MRQQYGWMIKKFNRLWRYPFYLLCCLLFLAIGKIVKMLNPAYRGIWLMAERGTEAQDNAYHLFRYIREHHPDIVVYYVIDPRNPDFSKVAELGKTVRYKSLLHHLLFAVSDYKISTHIAGYSPDILCYNRFDHMGLVTGKKIFLQHGIIKDNLTWLYYPNARVDLFVCGAYPEYLDIKQYYQHPDGVVQYLGLCRYDQLYAAKPPEKRILLMPTWRVYLDKMGPTAFAKTKYYQVIQSLLTNEHLLALLHQYGYDLYFMPHYDVLKFMDTFHTISSQIHLVQPGEYDVQELLLTAEILITDYSSVFFDFAYMGKAEIFYQFDEQEYRKNHYAAGYFDYRRDGFGPVCTMEEEVVAQVAQLLAQGTADKVYQARAERFFVLRDHNNCNRNFEAIRSLSPKGC